MTISANISRKHGWDVGRTSLRVRNPTNVPDAWEQKVLRDFEKRKAAGEDPACLECAEIVDQGGKPSFRYMKAIAIPAGAPCLACHGHELDASVAGKLKERYPNDKATGFREGDGPSEDRQRLQHGAVMQCTSWIAQHSIREATGTGRHRSL